MLLDFPLSTVNKFSATSNPKGQGAVGSGSSRTGILLSTEPVLTLQGIFTASPLVMVMLLLAVLTGQSSASLVSWMKLTNTWESFEVRSVNAANQSFGAVAIRDNFFLVKFSLSRCTQPVGFLVSHPSPGMVQRIHFPVMKV